MEKWGLPITVPNSDLSLRLGARFQSLATYRSEKEEGRNDYDSSQDFQARRVRLQFEAGLKDTFIYYMDIRNDNANQDDKGEQSFKIGDAYVLLPLIKSDENSMSFKFYRAKVDVSRTQTVSSSEILFVNRPYIADEASQFVNHNRRASNVQIVGQFQKKFTYQLAIGDGVQSDKFFDAKSKAIDSIERQNFMVGGKIRFHPISGWEDLRPTETYFGKGKHLSFGVGHFNTSKIEIENDAGRLKTLSRTLTNLEFSTHYKTWSLFSEYFIFDGVIEDHSAVEFNQGTGNGWYAQLEKVFPDFHFLAPFLRVERWDRFRNSGDYLSQSDILGLIWYANGNRFKMSLAYEEGRNGQDTTLAEKYKSYHFATAWHF